MVDYRLDQHATGTVQIGQTRWRFFSVRVMSLPENVCDLQMLVFGNLDRPGDIMRKRIPNDLLQVSDTVLIDLARDADEREISTERGRLTIRRVGGLHDERKWLIHSTYGHPFVSDVGIERAITELTDEDIRHLSRL